LARAYISGAATVGGKLTVDDMQGYRIDWTGPLRLPFANITLLFPPTRDGGAAASRLWTALARSGGLLSAARLDRDGIVAAMSQTRTGADGGAPVGGLASTGFATIDKDGQAVACAVSMGRPFGLRRTAGMSGIVLARTPGGADDEMPYLSAMIAINSNVHQVLAAVAASGGAVAPAAMVQTAAEALVANNTPARALAAPRLFRAGPAALLLREPGLDSEFVARIEGRGTASAEIGQLGRVGLLFCADGLPRAPASCRFAADPRGFGLAAGG
jgi:gamma-glutamyltranspeptidase/glutathione hydrolase